MLHKASASGAQALCEMKVTNGRRLRMLSRLKCFNGWCKLREFGLIKVRGYFVVVVSLRRLYLQRFSERTSSWIFRKIYWVLLYLYYG